jgi:NAD(P)-dependent dehydrogenase (short-subunit alcohol dehydrogenase family)
MNGKISGILTGAAGGIGSAIALRLARQGCNLVITDLNAGGLEALAAQVAPGAGRLVPLAGDMADPDLPTRLVRTALREFGALDALVNCSGWLKDHRVADMPLETFQRLLAINFTGPMRLVDAALAHMEEQGYGRVVSIASRAWLGNFGSSGYSTAKGALVGATRSLALKAAPRGVTVNCIAPGYIDTPMSRSMPPHIVQRVVDAIPVGRAGTVDDVSALVAFLLSRESGYVTGQTWLACGGRSISDPIGRAKPVENAS